MEKYMPWIIALSIGILSAVVNYIIGTRLRKSNESNLQKQIDNAKEITITQFKATIGTKNRQEWINELRNDLTEFITCAMHLPPPNTYSKEQNDKYVERCLFTKTKIELLLNNEKLEQKELLDSIQYFFELLLTKDEKIDINDFTSRRDLVIKSAKELFDFHWRKIKNLN